MKILLADEQPLLRAGLRLLLATIDPDLAVIEAGSLSEAVQQAAAHPDLRLCLLDPALGDGCGQPALTRFRAAAPEIVCAVVSTSQDAATIRACLDAGAMSYLPKSMPQDILTEALRAVIEGRVYLPAYVEETASSKGAVRPVLTPRQRDVLRGLCEGLPNKSIANRLGLSEFTVREHISTIFRILGVKNRTEAVIRSSRQHLWSRNR